MLSTKNTHYVGIDMDDLETPSPPTPGRLQSHTSYMSIIKERPRPRSSSRMPNVTNKEYWRQAVPKSKLFMQEAWEDLNNITGGDLRHLTWRLYTILGPLVFFACILAIPPIISLRRFYAVNNACRPDSGFHVGFGEFDIWATTGFFQITLGFGDLSFTTAKIIDVGWDVIVGRGGQGLLAAICFLIFSKALVRCMESTPVSYGTFEAVTIQCGSISSALKLIRDVFKIKTTQARASIIWMIISAMFVLAFPTLISAMTGYSVNIDSFVEVDNGNMVVYSNFSLVRYVIHDAYRIDEAFGKDYHVITGTKDNLDGQIAQLGFYSTSDACTLIYPSHNSSGNTDWTETRGTVCDFYWHVSEYAFKYGFEGKANGTTTFNNSGKLVNLTQPSLSITPIFWQQDWLTERESSGVDWWLWPYGYYWKDAQGNQPFHNFTEPIFTNGQYVYDLEELNQRGRCQQNGASYKWGFSFLILFSFIIMFLVWCLGMYIMWLDAFLHSRLDRVGRNMGLQRAVLDLAYCMQRDVDETGRDMLSNQDLQATIRQDLKGGRITYEMLEPKLLPISRASEMRLKWQQWRKLRKFGRPSSRSRLWTFEEMKVWLKNNPVPFALFILSLTFFIMSLAGFHTPLFSFALLLAGSVVVMLMGEDHKSRYLVFLFFCVLAAAFVYVGPFVYLDKHHWTVIWFSQNAYDSISWWYNH